MFEEWETFFRNFTNALTLQMDSHSPIVYTSTTKGNPPIENDVENETDDEMVFEVHHGLEDSDSNICLKQTYTIEDKK